MNAEYQTQLASTDLVVVWLSIEALLPGQFYSLAEQDADGIIALCKKLHANLTSVSHVKILWLLFEDYGIPLSVAVGHVCHDFADKLNLKLRDALGDQALFIDLKHFIAEVGILNAYDAKSKYRWNAPYSKTLVEAAVKEIHKQYLIEKGDTKKCLVLDCDNVLWGGILSEDGMENLKLGGSGLGHVYQDFQRFVLSLYHHGVILAVCSKNDLSDILTMFRKHSEMILREEHIACFEANWEDKPGNIKKIAEKLNISLDSMVFADDSPIEIEAVRAMLPEVTPILFKRNMDYEQFSCFNLKRDVSIADTLSLQGRRSEGIKSESCCVAFAPCTPGTCRSSVLHDADFMPSDSGDLKRREFLHFQGRRRRRTRSTLIEDNAENEEIIPF